MARYRTITYIHPVYINGILVKEVLSSIEVEDICDPKTAIVERRVSKVLKRYVKPVDKQWGDKMEKFLKIAEWARLRYTIDDTVVLYTSGSNTPYQNIVELAWRKYILTDAKDLVE